MTPALRLIVGTAGHVDHGKTALVKALTGIDTDRLPEEKRRGITLEAGYAHLQLPGTGVAGVVDVPGHERFLRAMVAAAGGIDVAVLCIAADEGPMPQTAEHLDVLRLLGVKAGVIALTKSDLLPGLGADHRELLLAEIGELVLGTFLEDAPIVECSARTGQGLRDLIEAIVRQSSAAPARPDLGPLFLPLDRSFAVKGFGTVVTGTLFSGALAAGDEVDLIGAGIEKRSVRVRGVQVHGAAVEQARAGQRTAANLAGIEVREAPRGAALVQAGSAAAHVLDVEVELLEGAPRALGQRTRLLAHLGTAQEPCVLALIDRVQLEPGERALAQLRFARPAPAIAGLRFLLRGELGQEKSNEPARKPDAAAAARKAARKHASTLGGGRVLSVGPRKRRRREADAAALRDLAGDDPVVQADRIVLEAGHAGATPQLLAARGAFTRKSAEKALARLAQTGRAVLFDRDAGLYAHAQLLEGLESKVHTRLAAATPREELRQKIGSPSPKLFAKALAVLSEKGELQADAESVRPPGVAAALHAPEEEKLARILDDAGLSPPRTVELAVILEETPQRTHALLKALGSAGRAVKVSEELWFGAQPMLALRRQVLAHLKENGEIDAQSFKEMTGLSRKFAIPLLEYFDKERLTLRVGDKRILRKAER
jgi:selenocysteine-specific elongation factor